ncbi:hypothetical protein [Streptomyces sp. HD]|uniref:hypothetical protein n=1 Tax=Streptomyces sp. HD TaxID=3020892 RepID=UPI00232D2E4B|nr:hypothetical protein [Streptomyces sp. HD]MDC0766554.1 hypothetical protein [Streptomyces sp. HD]
MVTARLPWCVGGTRFGGRPLLRVLAMAALLFGVLVTHCGHMESADGHLSSSAADSAALPGDGVLHPDPAVEPAPLITGQIDDHRGGHAASHSGEQCVSGQPQQGYAVAAPCFAAWVRQATGVDGASPLRPPAIGRSVDGVSPVALRAASVVRQV